MARLDTPVRLAAGRTPREILLIGHGIACIATALAHGDHTWNIYVYAAVTALFAIRFFAARVLYLSMAIGALALQLGCWMLPHVHLAQMAPVFLEILGCALLLCGGDLVRRFDAEGRGLGPIRNYWRELSVGQRRHIAWGVHLIGATGGLLHHTWYNAEALHQHVPLWLYAAVAGSGVVGFLYIWGRALAAPAAVGLGAAIAWKLWPSLGGAYRILHGKPARVPIEVALSAHYTLVAFVCAAAAAALAVPWTLRWLGLATRPVE